MGIVDLIKKHEEYIISMRRYFHANPELSGEEINTVKKISNELESMGIEYTLIEKGGILAKITGGNSDKAVLLRADVDALKIDENADNLIKNGRTCVSKNKGVMHACGHDGHTAMLLGAAKALSQMKDKINGTIYLCFECGEELIGYARYILKYIEDNHIKIDTVFGMHLYSGLESGKIIINDADVMAGNITFDVTIIGKGGHGSRPDQAISPIDCFAHVHQRLLEFRKDERFKKCTYSVGQVFAGSAKNIIPQTLSFGGTMRTFDMENVGEKFFDEFINMLENTTKEHGCKAEYNMPVISNLPLINDSKFASFARETINKKLGENFVSTGEPWMATESFSNYTYQWPGVFALVGIKNDKKGTGAPHHNNQFDIDEDVLINGTLMHVVYALEYLKSELQGVRKMSYRALLDKARKTNYIKELYNE